ncbi:acyl carrier protein [Rothia halotolerans]|uniref:acyl carrier protein n=1 Tax=Rothia halotolerans TaxID=405770 RepID=UPI00101D4761|nr:acyl carrier protein [Rothia halotolerans]
MSSTIVTEDHLRSIVFEILDDAFGVESPDLKTTLEDIGVDSLGLIELIAEIETRINSPEELEGKLAGLDRTGTLGALIERLHGAVNALPPPPSSSPRER